MAATSVERSVLLEKDKNIGPWVAVVPSNIFKGYIGPWVTKVTTEAEQFDLWFSVCPIPDRTVEPQDSHISNTIKPMFLGVL